jgi:hypothetical protein
MLMYLTFSNLNSIHWRQTEKEKKRAEKTEKIIYTLFCELKIKIKKY